MLGLTVLAFQFFSRGWDLAGAVAFVASLGFKQMALYYSPAVFAYLFGKCLLWGWKSGCVPSIWWIYFCSDMI
jgi:alpha-1,3-glucosyltransferase